MGQWYYISYDLISFSECDWSYDGVHTDELVFTKSVAKHVLRKAKDFTKGPHDYSDYPPRFYVTGLALLTPDGQMVTGFIPKSIAHLFHDPQIFSEDRQG